MVKKYQGKGFKERDGKLRMDLIPTVVITGLAEVLTYGAIKYSANSWQHVDDPINTYYGACLRHLIKWRDGEDIDPESGLHHLKHSICNLMFLLYFSIHQNRKQKSLYTN